MPLTALSQDIEYPESDGEPMADTDAHFDEMVYAVKALQVHFAAHPEVYVSGDLFLYYVQGDASKSVAPDIFVVFGVDKKKRDTYLLWKEGVAPSFVLELSSKSTRQRDTGVKKDLYARLGVTEYYLFDPRSEDFDWPPLQGYRLLGGKYREVAPSADGSYPSPSLGLSLKAQEGKLRFFDAASGVPLLRFEEEHDERLVQTQRAEREAARAEREAEGRQAAELRAERAEERADREAQEHRALADELTKLRRELESRR
jgi:Uma2 family endonuclease